MLLEHLQIYWWLIISVLGGILVFLLFVQGGQSMLLEQNTERNRDMIVTSMGQKWELTFTTLVTFGGALFAAFPLFYSTSFGGAYWLWMLILFSFVLQAVSYEYRKKKGNVYGTRTYDWFLFINGTVGCLLLGVAVSLFFFGAEFSVGKGNLLDGSAPVISQWAPTHGFEAIFCWKNLILGVALFFLARTQGCLYMINNIDDAELAESNRKKTLINGLIFAIFFVWFLVMVLLADGLKGILDSFNHTHFEHVDNIFLTNLLNNWWLLAILIIGVVMVLYAIFRTGLQKSQWSGIGTFLVVVSLLAVTAFNNTAYLRSLTDPESSLTLSNSSSSMFTLTAMSYVSILVPFVVAYIAYVWYSMNKKRLNFKEMEELDH